jgi:putative nucleotidyltransferase with HDIG domain
VYQALNMALADPDVDVKKLAGIVEADVAMTARVLHFVNSAYYGLTRQITSIEEGIVFLGISTLRNLTLTLEVFAAFQGAERLPNAFEEEERHSLLTARIARRIVADAERAESVFAGGLLHDCGKLVLMDRLPGPFAEAQAKAQRDQCAPHAAERAIFGSDHAEVGACILGLWGLPHTIIEAVAFHHSEDRLTKGALDGVVAVAAANRLARMATRSRQVEAGDTDVIRLHELAAGNFAAWSGYAEREAAEFLGGLRDG